MICQNYGCRNQTEGTDLTCVDCFAREELRLVEESMARVESGESAESVRIWFFDSLTEKAENAEYRKRYNNSSLRKILDIGLMEILGSLGFYGIDGKGLSQAQQIAAGSFGVFVFPPTTPFWSELSAEERSAIYPQ
jgi:hypothetical protein